MLAGGEHRQLTGLEGELAHLNGEAVILVSADDLESR